MGQVGHFGDVKFYVKAKGGEPEALSFDDMQWKTSINVSEHKRQGKKPLLEVTGKNCDEITMDIYLYASLGIKPWKNLLALRKYNLNGKIYPLVIGGRRIGSHKFIITDISNSLQEFYKNGKPTAVVASVTFKEYPLKKGKSNKQKTVSSSSSSSSKSSSSSNSASGSSSKSRSKSGSTSGYTTYTIKSGDTLWGLAVTYYGSGKKYTKIYNANKTKSSGFDVITDPDKLTVGWVIKIPD